MVFHNIESITDVLSGHRVIIYYIEGDITSKWNLRNSVESVMEMLGKKNDDMIIFKVCQNTHQFNQFKELYKPEIRGPIALFVINTDGIPLICEEIYDEDNIYQAFDSICTYCKLNAISKNEITNIVYHKSRETLGDKTNTDIATNGLHHRPPHQVFEMQSLSDGDLPVLDFGSEMNKPSEEGVQSMSTVLQIRLPDGTKENQKFDKHAFLQEVYDFIHTKFNLNNFDLKTYDHSVFSVADYESTLQDLDLTPNGVVIVVYKNVVPFSNNGSISRMIQYGFGVFFIKVTSIFQFIQGLLFAFWNGFFSSGTGSSRQIQNQAQAGQSGNKKSVPGVKRSLPRFGNIHTLRRSEDSDDENNRYNGNSTQQK